MATTRYRRFTPTARRRFNVDRPPRLPRVGARTADLDPATVELLASAWTPPEHFDEYRLLQPLGRGQMGQVYLAYDSLLSRRVAIKFATSATENTAARERFLVEARAAARLQHPNVVTIYRVGELDGHPYLISEFVEGQALDRVARPMPWTRALEIGVDLARGLAAAHRMGVLHRDLKCANAMLTQDGRAKLLDFGLAKLLEHAPSPVAPARPSAATAQMPVVTDETPPLPVGASAAETLPPVEPAPPEPPVMMPPKKPSLRLPVAIPLHARDTFVEPGTEPTPEAERAATSELDERIARDVLGRHLTSAGTIMGTPDYMAPETWRAQPATRASDVYSLGAVLFELVTGRTPFANLPVSELRKAALTRNAPSVTSLAPSVDARFAAIVDRCLAREPAQRFSSGDAVREALERLERSAGQEQDARPDGNPYRGLRAFDAEHRAIFFGREHEIGVLLDRLRSEPFVLVTGDSGVGKSSLCRAGVVSRVRGGSLDGARAWTAIAMTPGRRPLSTLAATLARPLGMAEDELGAILRDDVDRTIATVRDRLGERAGVLILVDQLEELVTLADPREAERVEALLARLPSEVSGVRLLATLRADFLTRLAQLPSLGEEVQRALYLLKPLTREKMREVIVAPVRESGVGFESDELVDRLVETSANADGALPLLQFTLAELWEARDRRGGRITAAALEAMGGVAGALARHAEEVVAELLPAQRAWARRVLVRLVGADGKRLRRNEAELTGGDGAARAALDRLVRGRLVVAHDADAGSAFELAHGVLISGWSTLRRWVLEDADLRSLREQLVDAVADWERANHAEDALWSARRLATAAPLDESTLNPRERVFLAASRRAVRRARVRRVLLVASVPLAIAVLLLGLEWNARRTTDARVRAQLAPVDAQLATAHERAEAEAAERRHAFTLFDGGHLDEAEAAWTHARALGHAAEHAYATAAQALEAALAIAPARKDVRARLGDVLYERALLAELHDAPAERDELSQRLRLYDDDGARQRRWNAPAMVSIVTTPVDVRADVRLERYVEDDQQHLTALPAGDLGATPVDGVTLPQGSYRLVVSARGRATVRYPLVARRGETLRIELPLPVEPAVPSGFVYVAPGRALFGSSAEDAVRTGFLGTVPLHDVTTGAYLIARNEVTAGEWIQFLDALEPVARGARTPHVDAAAGMNGSVRWRRLSDGTWRFAWLPDQRHEYAAVAGARIHYEERDRRADASWLRFPVTGISAEDAAAYVAWLDATGRVAGARLCSEREWERAARGADGRDFPHGNHLDADDTNHDVTYGKRPLAMGPDEIGAHPASRSPFELDDTSGNAFEWTTSALEPGGYVARGGAYFYDAKTGQLANRQVLAAGFRDATLGVRVCATPR